MINGIRLICILFFFSFCFSLYAEIRIAVIPDNPRPGEPVTIGVVGIEDGHLQAVLISGQGRQITKASFFNMAQDKEGRAVHVAILAVPCTARSGTALIQVENRQGALGNISLTIGNREFVSEEIRLDQRNTDLRTIADPQKTAESSMLWGIINRTGTDIYAPGPFTPPVQSTRRTSFFGDRRVYRYVDGSSDFSIHAGIDYGVPKGTEVQSCAPGKVVFARSRIVTGNSVIIEHLPGVYSLYYHLDQLQVKEGTMVDTGTVLGQSGATGLATGPHLHWEIRVAGENTDPDAFVGKSILDKEAILSIFNSF